MFFFLRIFISLFIFCSLQMWRFPEIFLHGSGTSQCNWRRRALHGNGRSADCTKYAYNDYQVSVSSFLIGFVCVFVSAVSKCLKFCLKFRLFQSCSAMSTNRNRDEIGPMRNRSSSANEASKPILVLQRRQTHMGSKTLNFSPSNGGNTVAGKSIQSIFILMFTHNNYVRRGRIHKNPICFSLKFKQKKRKQYTHTQNTLFDIKIMLLFCCCFFPFK